MSLLTTASPWTNDDLTISKKRPSTMRNSIKNTPQQDTEYSSSLKTNLSQTTPYNESQIPTIEKSEEINNNRNLKINDILNKMNLSVDNDGSQLGNFNPPPNPVVFNKKPPVSGKTDANELLPSELLPKNPYQSTILPAGFMKNTPGPTNNYRANESNLGNLNNYNNIYEPSQISTKPYYSKMGIGANVLDDKLMDKINYMIHLLEEQQNEKTNNITEEFVLYTFLGIFIIFVVDSFARAGKYVR
jgi:hypothetical protein